MGLTYVAGVGLFAGGELAPAGGTDMGNKKEAGNPRKKQTRKASEKAALCFAILGAKKGVL